jgi:hypothetical protein
MLGQILLGERQIFNGDNLLAGYDPLNSIYERKPHTAPKFALTYCPVKRSEVAASTGRL